MRTPPTELDIASALSVLMGELPLGAMPETSTIPNEDILGAVSHLLTSLVLQLETGRSELQMERGDLTTQTRTLMGRALSNLRFAVDYTRRAAGDMRKASEIET